MMKEVGNNFKKGEIVLIKETFSLRKVLDLPSIGKVACSEKVKERHLANHPGFEFPIGPQHQVLIEVPRRVVEVSGIYYLKGIQDLLDEGNSEESLDTMFVLARKIVIPVEKKHIERINRVYKPKAYKVWKELKTKGKLD